MIYYLITKHKKMKYTFILFIVLSIKINTQIIYLPYNVSKGPSIILVGQSKEEQYDLYIDQEVPYSIFYDLEYKESEVIKQTKLKINDKEISLNLIEQNLYISNYSISLQYYNLEKKDDRTFSNLALSFAKECEDSKKCLVNRLKDEGKINKLEYTFEKVDLEEYIDEESIIYIGGVPNNVIKDKNMVKCKVDKSNSNWSCNLRGISFGVSPNELKYEEINDKITFQVRNEDFQVPEKFLSFYKSKILKVVIEKGWCRYYDSPDIYIAGYQCKNKAMKLIPTIHLLIGNFYLSFPSKLFFELPKDSSDEEEYVFLNIQKNPFDKWSIGGRFINHYISRFNYEDNTISFYSDDKFVVDNKYDEFSNSALRWIILTIVILILGIGLLVYVRINKKKDEVLLDFEKGFF